MRTCKLCGEHKANKRFDMSKLVCTQCSHGYSIGVNCELYAFMFPYNFVQYRWISRAGTNTTVEIGK